jgi:hypothetical protein
VQSAGSYLSAQGVPTGYAGEEIIGTMTFAPLIWALEIDGKPTLAFEAMKYREAHEIYHQEWLRIELGQRKINDVPLCGADAHLRIRLARPAEILLYRQAAEGNKLSDNNLVYLIEIDEQATARRPERSRDGPSAARCGALRSLFYTH